MPLALLLTQALLPFPAGSALATSGADVTPKNQTGNQVYEVYVNAHSSKRWGKDVKGTRTRRTPGTQ